MTASFLCFVLAPALVIILALTSQARGSDDVGSQRLVCYSELWAGTRPSPANYDLSTLPAENCDYLILVYLTLDPDTWKLRMNTGYGDVDPEDLRKAGRLRKNHWLKVLLSVGGWADGVAKYSDMISDGEKRKSFVDSVVDTLALYEMDGLELHWLYPGAVWRGGRAGDKDNFLRLVEELQKVFKPKGWILTASVPPDETNLRGGYNVRRLNSHLHQMHIRTLDMRGDWTGYASAHCPLYSSHWEKPDLRNMNVNDSLSLWLREGASARKLLLTFPFYGRSFTLKDESKTVPGSPISGPGPETLLLKAPGLMAYFEICDAVQNKRLEQGYQSEAEAPYATGNELWVGYDDEDSLKKKIKLLDERKVGGAAVFAVSMDDFAGTCGSSHFLLHRTRQLMDEHLTAFLDPRVQGKP